MDPSSSDAAKHALSNVSPGATEKRRETRPPEGSGSSSSHKRRVGSLSDSPLSDSDPKPKTSRGKAKEVTPEDGEGNVPSSSIPGGPEQITRKRRRSLMDSPLSDDPKPKRPKGKAKASPEDREGNPSSSIQGRIGPASDAEVFWAELELRHFENRRSSKRQPQKDLSKLHPVIVLDIYRDSRGKDIARYLPLSHDFNGNKNIRVGYTSANLEKPNLTHLMIECFSITKRGLENLRRATEENAPRTRSSNVRRDRRTDGHGGRVAPLVQGPGDAGPSSNTSIPDRSDEDNGKSVASGAFERGARRSSGRARKSGTRKFKDKEHGHRDP